MNEEEILKESFSEFEIMIIEKYGKMKYTDITLNK